MKQFSLKYSTPQPIVSQNSALIPPEKRKVLDTIYHDSDGVIAVLYSYTDGLSYAKQEQVRLNTEALIKNHQNQKPEDDQRILQYLASGTGLLSQFNYGDAPYTESLNILYVPELDRFYLITQEDLNKYYRWLDTIHFARKDLPPVKEALMAKQLQEAKDWLGDKYIQSVSVQKKNIKLTVSNVKSSKTEPRRYSSYNELKRYIKPTRGGAIRRVRNGTSNITDSVLYVFRDKDGDLAIWTYKEDGKYYTVMVNNSSVEMYMEVIKDVVTLDLNM